jgi:hypothetical protein
VRFRAPLIRHCQTRVSYPEEYQVAVKHISEQSSVEKSDIEAIISKIQTKTH